MAQSSSPKPSPQRSCSIFESPDAEVCLRSADNFNFFVHKPILRRISSIFDDILSLPQPTLGETVCSRPVIQMSEEAVSVRLLLLFCYPRTFCDEPVITSIEDIKRVAGLADKYDIDFLHQKAKQALVEYTTVSSAVAYIVAWRFGYQDTLRIAARRSLDVPEFLRSITELDHGEMSEFGKVPGSALKHLVRYHHCIPARLEPLLLGTSSEHAISWIRPETVEADPLDLSVTLPPSLCSCSKTVLWFHWLGRWNVCSWWWSYVRDVVTSMQSPNRPELCDALDDALLSCFAAAAPCGHCVSSGNVFRVLKCTKTRLSSKIERLIEEVSIQLYFLFS